MMDSQENTLEQQGQEAAAKAEETERTAETVTPEETPEGQVSLEEEADKKVYTSKKAVLERAKEIAQSDEKPEKAEVDHLKTAFYKLHAAERDAKMKEYLDKGGDPEKYEVLPDDDEEAFKAEMQIIKEKRAKFFEKEQAERQENLAHRMEIINKVKNMATSPEEANKSYNDFKALQLEWKKIGPVPPEHSSETWRNYQLYVEQFYDLLNLNREAREYDFQKNLEAKTKLCEEAEKLADEPDVISAFYQLQDLHQQFREIGPVEKDLREEIWNRFKAASTVINKKHQQHFEELRSKEEENLAKKTALCEKAEAIDKSEKNSAKEWEAQTKEIIALQKEWRKIGFAPQKMNVKIFERFRAANDDFFGRKQQFFKNLKEEMTVNVEKKKELVAKAEALKDSTEWRSTSDKLIALQKEWKTIGMVPKKIGDELWKQFTEACNHFFEVRNSVNGNTHSEEHANLDKKKEIIEKLKTLLENTAEDAQETVQRLTDEYNKIGHVPYKDKDKIYKEYHDVVDKLYSELHVSIAKKRLDNFKGNLKNLVKKGEDAVDNERGRLMHRYEQLKSEITTYENNLGFLNASSKKGNSLVDEMNRKVEKLKDEAQLIREKIKAIDAENK